VCGSGLAIEYGLIGADAVIFTDKGQMKNKEQTIDKVVGVISDTHGLLRPEAVAALQGVDLILHAGDVGSAEVLETLKGIAPVVAVRGNNDKGAWANELPHWEVAEVGAIYIYMIHDLKEIDISPAGVGFQVVVSGHSHKPAVEERKGVLYVNPGSAGPRRFSLPISVARIQVNGDFVTAEILQVIE
jgi:putative phosphoesterase